MENKAKFATKAPWEESNATPVNSLSFISSSGIGRDFSTHADAFSALSPFVTNTAFAGDNTLILTTCTHMGIPTSSFESMRYNLEDFYFIGGSRLDRFIKEENLQQVSDASYIVYKNKLPVASLSVNRHPARNYNLSAFGEEQFVERVRQLACDLLRPVSETATPARFKYIELQDYDYRNCADWRSYDISRETAVKDDYYPYIAGGVENLMAQFIASDETVMVWYGDPGTGKTSAIRSMVSSMGILPIIAMKLKVLAHENFLRDIFAYSDDTHARNATNRKLAAAISSADTSVALQRDTFSRFVVEKWNIPLDMEFETRIPIIVIEDADILISSRDSGNLRMNQLLNEVDGLGTNNSRKVIFTSNKTDLKDVDQALLRDGRCFGAFNFRKLTPEEAVVARAAAGLPEFENVPTKDVALATALAKPRQKFIMDKNKVFGFA